ncbi:MAG: hypothetical protein K6A94_02175 [Bacteroidales bacterium]|nr:hypothetical protein [Bacteroidales bacterium]
MITDAENVARAIFSPRMIIDGELQPAAFRLRASLNEDYLSVIRMAVSSWLNDIMLIPQRKNRQLYGYAEMNVGEIRSIRFKDVMYDVTEVRSEAIRSHAGIFIQVKGENLIGGKKLESIQAGAALDFMPLAIQRELVDIAQKGFCQVVKEETEDKIQ